MMRRRKIRMGRVLITQHYNNNKMRKIRQTMRRPKGMILAMQWLPKRKMKMRPKIQSEHFEIVSSDSEVRWWACNSVVKIEKSRQVQSQSQSSFLYLHSKTVSKVAIINASILVSLNWLLTASLNFQFI